MNQEAPGDQCVILVGGRGTRLGALTEQFPKPLLRVGDRPWALAVALTLGLGAVLGRSGATILGEGRVVLILDVGALVRIAHERPQVEGRA